MQRSHIPQERLDLFLSRVYPDFSRNFWQKFVRSHGVKVNGAFIRKPHHTIRATDKVIFSRDSVNEFLASLKAPQALETIPQERILYSDDVLFVIDKPPYVRTETIAHGFFPAHRLDKNTSGVLVLARDPITQEKLQSQWKAKTVKKTYLALVKGHLQPKRGAIEASLSRSIKDRRKIVVSVTPQARAAYTEYEVINYCSMPARHSIGKGGFVIQCSLLRITPHTGRTHQIRVHLAAIGHPIIGDEVYGDKKLNQYFEEHFGLRRQALHAAALEFDHTITKKRLRFEAPLPEDLQKTLDSLSS